MTIKEMEICCQRLLDPSNLAYEAECDKLEATLDFYTMKTMKKMMLTFYVLHEQYRRIAFMINTQFSLMAISLKTMVVYLRPVVEKFLPDESTMWYVTGGSPKNYVETKWLMDRYPSLFSDHYTTSLFLAKHMDMVRLCRQHTVNKNVTTTNTSNDDSDGTRTSTKTIRNVSKFLAMLSESNKLAQQIVMEVPNEL